MIGGERTWIGVVTMLPYIREWGRRRGGEHNKVYACVKTTSTGVTQFTTHQATK
jgi:hypothetical protein